MTLYLLDTHLILWGAAEPHRIPAAARGRIEDPANALAFSVIAIWEVTIKLARRRPGFAFDPARLRRLLVAAGYREIAITGEHALAVRDMPPIHADPFDRILIAQARVEGARLLTVDATMARYGDPVEAVR